jgi:hypothetical protein
VSVGVRNPNRRPVEYTLVLRGQTKPVSVAGGERGVITLAGVANGAHPVRVSGRDETEADTVVTVDCAPASATTVTTATITGASGTAAPQPQSRSDVALADTGAAVGGLAGLGALSLGLGGALLITGRWRARRD